MNQSMQLQNSQSASRHVRRILRWHHVADMMSLSIVTLRRLAKDPTSGFPRPIPIGAQAVGFDLDELEAWIESRKEARAA